MMSGTASRQGKKGFSWEVAMKPPRCQPMAKSLQKPNAQSLKLFRVLNLTILSFSLIFVADVVLYFVLGGSIRDFVVMMASLYLVVVTIAARLRFQPEFGRQILMEWLIVSSAGIILSLYLTFFFSL